MNSPSARSSPSYKHLKLKHQSPIELKQKMRKGFRNKLQESRNLLMTKFRGQVLEMDVRKTFTDIYKEMFNFSDELSMDDEETSLLEEIKNEIVQEELDWWLQEYDKSEMANVDWSFLEQNDQIICPVCQKANFAFSQGMLSCSICKSSIKTCKMPSEIKNIINTCVENHSSCNSQLQFTKRKSELQDIHIYLVCETCMDMQLVPI